MNYVLRLHATRIDYAMRLRAIRVGDWKCCEANWVSHFNYALRRAMR